MTFPWYLYSCEDTKDASLGEHGPTSQLQFPRFHGEARMDSKSIAQNTG